MVSDCGTNANAWCSPIPLSLLLVLCTYTSLHFILLHRYVFACLGVPFICIFQSLQRTAIHVCLGPYYNYWYSPVLTYFDLSELWPRFGFVFIYIWINICLGSRSHYYHALSLPVLVHLSIGYYFHLLWPNCNLVWPGWILPVTLIASIASV